MSNHVIYDENMVGSMPWTWTCKIIIKATEVKQERMLSLESVWILQNPRRSPTHTTCVGFLLAQTMNLIAQKCIANILNMLGEV